MEKRRGWLGLLLCLLLTGLVVYGYPRFAVGLWAGDEAGREMPFTILADAAALNGYASTEQRLWLISQLEQIDGVRAFALPEAIAQLERVDYDRFVVVVLLTKVNAALTVDHIRTQDGMLAVDVQDRGAQPLGTSTYQFMQIPRNRTTQAPRKLVLQLPPTAASPSSPLPGPDIFQPTSPLSQ